MKIKRTNISLPESLFLAAEQLMKEQHFSDFSGFVQHLIREESKRSNQALQARLQQLRATADNSNSSPKERVAAHAEMESLLSQQRGELNEPGLPYGSKRPPAP